MDVPRSAGTELRTRLAALRAELARRGLDGFLVPRADAHLGEHVPAHAQRLAWLTGFTGSAGIAVVLRAAAAIFVDGRYTLQVRGEVDTTLFTPCHLTDEPPEVWIEKNLSAGRKLGFDPWLHGEKQAERLRAAAGKAGAELVAVDDNPVDAVWSDRPPPPRAPVAPHPLAYAGRASTEKRAEVAAALAKQGAEAAVLTLPDSIAWLLNVRGGDVAHSPLPLSFAVLRADAAVDWFIEPAKLGPGLDAHLGNGVAVHPPDALGPALDALGAAGKRVLADPETVAAWVFARLRAAGAEVVPAPDPCQLPKARKNPVELAGARAAHLRDGRAVVRFLAWLDGESEARARRGRGVSEIEAAERLLAFRRENELFRDLSFETISGAGPNGAIVHYRASGKTSRRLGPGELYLVDSGAQYLDGTTDVTRTVPIGSPGAEMRERFTRVLKGHIALATARFPPGTTGHQLDALARYHLWQAGLDYDHGTGHGVGSYLNVHEGPQRISKFPQGVALEPGMIVSNEPGYYKAGAYGIRIENLVTVIESPACTEDEKDMLAFETLTLVPIDLRLVEPGLLGPAEAAWLDAYHARVRAAHADGLDSHTKAWLRQATRPLGG
ncbi:MAG: aminopeptidase P family protein [Kiloniellaceae bacterium]